MIPDHPVILALDQDCRDAMKNPLVIPVVRGLLVRTRFIDDQSRRAVADGARQIVILGAGFDSRAYRLKELLRSVKVFEVDFPPTQEYKKWRVCDVLGAPPPNLVYVPIDFTR